jgi:glycerol uptake facilitator-like aquaporin
MVTDADAAGVSNNEMWGLLGRTSWDPKVLDASQAFFIEMLITAVLVFTVFASCDGKRTDLNGSTPLTIGFSVTVCHLFAVSISRRRRCLVEFLVELAIVNVQLTSPHTCFR